MTEIDRILPKKQEKQQAFILDHGKIEEGRLKYVDDQTSYGWNIKRYNRLKEGAFVLNRHPSKLSKDKKFEIYAGGYVEQISKPDEDGNVPEQESNNIIEVIIEKNRSGPRGTVELMFIKEYNKFTSIASKSLEASMPPM